MTHRELAELVALFIADAHAAFCLAAADLVAAQKTLRSA